MSSDPWGWQPIGPCRSEQAGYLIRLDGPDTGRFLHGQTSSVIEGQQPGSWIPSCCTTATGRLRALAEVLVDRDGAWLLLRGADGTALWQALERVLFPADRVQLGPEQRCVGSHRWGMAATPCPRLLMGAGLLWKMAAVGC